MGRPHPGGPEPVKRRAPKAYEGFPASCQGRANGGNWPAAAKNWISPFPFPLRGKPGREGGPPRRKHAARQQKALASVAAAGSPHKRAAAPLCIPYWLGRSIGGSGEIAAN